MACALDQAALRCKAKPSCNAAGGKTIDAQVAKAINDNLKGWGALEMPVKFSWLLSPSLATEVETMRKQALIEASISIASVVAKAKRGGGHAGSSSSSATLPLLKKSKSQHVSELDAALAMFKGSS